MYISNKVFGDTSDKYTVTHFCANNETYNVMKKIIFILAFIANATLSYASIRVDSIIEHLFYTWEDVDTIASEEVRYNDTVFTYDANNNVISKKTYNYRYNGGLTDEWVLEKSEDFVYNAENLCIEHTRTEWVKGLGYNDPNEWLCNYKEAYSYANGKKTEMIMYDFDSYTKTLSLSYKKVYVYANDLLSEVDHYVYNHASSSWATQISSKVTYTYNANGQIVTEIKQEYKSGAWKNSTKYVYEYNENNQLISKTESSWTTTDTGGYFSEQYQFQYTYDTNGNLLQCTNCTWQTSYPSGWIPYSIYAYTYSASNKLLSRIITRLNKNTQQWEGFDKLEYEYDVDGDTYRVTDWDWDNSTNDWTGYRRYYYYHHGKPAPTYELIVYAVFEDDTPWTEDYVEPCVVTGSGRYAYNSQVSAQATCTNDYVFAYWMDGNTDNPRTFTMDGNFIMWAYFGKNTGMEISNVKNDLRRPYKVIIDGNLLIIIGNERYNANGQQIK